MADILVCAHSTIMNLVVNETLLTKCENIYVIIDLESNEMFITLLSVYRMQGNIFLSSKFVNLVTLIFMSI